LELNQVICGRAVIIQVFAYAIPDVICRPTHILAHHFFDHLLVHAFVHFFQRHLLLRQFDLVFAQALHVRLVLVGELVVNAIIEVQIVVLFVVSVDRARQVSKLNRPPIQQKLIEQFFLLDAVDFVLPLDRVERGKNKRLSRAIF
jgi:hypothetical protein